MAVLMNNVPLPTFFLANGLDPNKSHLFSKRIIDVATTNPAIERKVLDLLTANKAWRNT